MISIDRVYGQLKQQTEYISVVELAMELEASVSEVRQRLNELGDRVTCNEHDEWRVVGDLVQKLELSPLSASEIEERGKLENIVRESFYTGVQALKTLRDKKLYKETHTSFFSYVEDTFGFTRRNADYLIRASEVVENLKREPMVLGTNVLPTSERQCREVAKLPAEQQPEAWLASIKRANGKIPSGRIIKEVVNEIKGEPKMKPEPKKDGIVRVPGIGIEYIAHLEEETYYLLKEYQERVSAATFNGAIRRLLDEEKQRSKSV